MGDVDMKTIMNIENAMKKLFNTVVVDKIYDITIPCDIVSDDTNITEIQLIEIEPNKFELAIQTTRFYHRSYYHSKKELHGHITSLYEDANSIKHSKKKNRDKDKSKYIQKVCISAHHNIK